MKFALVFCFLFVSLNLIAADDWDAIYEAKKAEITREFERIDSARQELEAYRAATKSLFDKREAEISKKEENIKNMLAKNEKILEELKTMTSDKVLEVYAKMKDSPAANIISSLPRDEAAKILYALEPKKISSILSKMDPATAAELTEILKKDDLFTDNNSSVK
ncbi:5'-nucleosidase [Campylobacter fetus subsp. fetus]|uniref:MotE family protein n=1 Tax=Campylobacter fetus TaxID=196 RepID=UPI000818BECD|nr:5'-nucleosidase [Campylobacter fetus]OCS16448.1 5'-nucleosidase [Campylobacter fetus subsp. fetus]